MKLTEIRSEYIKLRKETKRYIGKQFMMDGSVIGLTGEFLFKIDDIDIQNDAIQVSYYSPEEGFEDEDPWLIEFVTLKTLEENAKWIGDGVKK